MGRTHTYASPILATTNHDGDGLLWRGAYTRIVGAPATGPRLAPPALVRLRDFEYTRTGATILQYAGKTTDKRRTKCDSRHGRRFQEFPAGGVLVFVICICDRRFWIRLRPSVSRSSYLSKPFPVHDTAHSLAKSAGIPGRQCVQIRSGRSRCQSVGQATRIVGRVRCARRGCAESYQRRERDKCQGSVEAGSLVPAIQAGCCR